MSASNYTINDGYVLLPVTVNPNTIYQDAVKAINAQLPGWIPRESHLEVILLEQFAAMTAEAANVAAAVPQSIFAYYGALLGILPNTGSAATALTTWTMVDDKGYTVPRGTTVGYQVLGNQLYTFTTQTAFTVPVGTTQAHDVNIQATQVGTIYNTLVPQSLVLVSPSLVYVSSIASTTTSSGGETPEGLTSYLNRLSNELQLLSPRPILTPDFAILARNVPGVYRASAYNNLNPFANNLDTEDATFSGGLGSWTVVSGCTISNQVGPSGELSMQVKATGSADAVVETGLYPIPQDAFISANVSIDSHIIVPHVTLSVICYDITGGVITTGVFSTGIVLGRILTFLPLSFTTPPNTTHVRLRVVFSSQSATEENYVAAPGLFQLNGPPVNFVPDSTMKQIISQFTWKRATSLAVEIFATGQYALQYTGTGSASSTQTGHSQFFELPAGTYYASAYIDATNVTSGPGPAFYITGASGTTMTVQTPGKKGIVNLTFTLTRPALVSFDFTTNTCTVQSGLPLVFASPLLVAGSTPQPYSPGLAWGPPDAIYNNERMVTVSVVDKTGDALDTSVENAVSIYLESLREVNFVVNVIGPSYTTIDVTWAGFVTTTATPTTTKTAANAALSKYLSPAFWGGGTLTPPLWHAALNVVRYLEVATVLGETPGLTLTTLAIGYHNGTLGTSNLTLYGFAPLPKVGTINGVVTTS